MRYGLSTAARSIQAALLISALLVAPLQAGGEPQKPVQRFQEALMHVMQQGQVLGFEGRRRHLAAIVDEVFDLPHITRAVIGRYWETLSAAERQRLARQIRGYALATLASRFDAYDGQSFVLGSRSPAGDAGMRIKSQFGGPDTDVSLDYLVHRDSQGRWRIRNVWFDGVSGTDIQQKEFAAFLRRGGAATLIAKLEEIIARLGRES